MAYVMGLLNGMLLYSIVNYSYKRKLLSKAKAYKNGTTNVEYILGKPCVILTEEDYCKYCIPWYDQVKVDKE